MRTQAVHVKMASVSLLPGGVNNNNKYDNASDQHMMPETPPYAFPSFSRDASYFLQCVETCQMPSYPDPMSSTPAFLHFIYPVHVVLCIKITIIATMIIMIINWIMAIMIIIAGI